MTKRKKKGKGGKRDTKGEYRIGKGMGLRDHHVTLMFANNGTEFTTMDLLDYCNSEFGRFGPDSRDETCRSWCKELWRFGWLEVLDSNGDVINLNPKTWKKSPKGRKFRITVEGRRIAKLPEEYFPEEIAKIVVNKAKEGIHPQCEQILEPLRKEEKIPIDYFAGGKMTDVVRDSYKAITFGFLEATGIIFAADEKNFVLNKEYFNKLWKS